MGSRLALLAGVVALLAVGLLAAAFGNPAIEALPIPQVTVSGQPRPLDDPQSELAQVLPPEATSPTAGAAGGIVLIVLGVLILIAAIGLAIWLARGAGTTRFARIRPVARPSAPVSAGRVRAAIDRGLSDLDEADADPRRAVIACWVRLERAAAEAGVSREPGDTSTDLVSRVLAGHQVSAEVLASLAELYREARFATHGVDPSTRDRARSALRQLRSELGPVRPAAPGGGAHRAAMPSKSGGTR
jgi:uncharacterized protein DUF4129